jgi:hypothetical protein
MDADNVLERRVAVRSADGLAVGTGVCVGGGVTVCVTVAVSSGVGDEVFVWVRVGGGVMVCVIVIVEEASAVGIKVGEGVGGGVTDRDMLIVLDASFVAVWKVGEAVILKLGEGLSETENGCVMDIDTVSTSVIDLLMLAGFVRLAARRSRVRVYVTVARSGVKDLVAERVLVGVCTMVCVNVSWMVLLPEASSLSV